MNPLALSALAHRRWIGALGLSLPLLLWLLAGVRPTGALPRWSVLDSVSAYYYSGAVGVFVGVLFALALFLITYQGYAGVVADRLVGFVGGLAALGVALFPTNPPPGIVAPDWWSDRAAVIHYVSAVTLFVCFIVFALWLFRKSDVPRGARRPLAKRRRDGIFLACGVAMIGAVGWAGVAGMRGGAIFVPESIAIVAFAISWLVKGEVEAPVLRAMRRWRGRRDAP